MMSELLDAFFKNIFVASGYFSEIVQTRTIATGADLELNIDIDHGNRWTFTGSDSEYALIPNTDNVYDIGKKIGSNRRVRHGYFSQSIVNDGYYELRAIDEPDAPIEGAIRLYADIDNTGKSRLMVKFSNGQSQVVATSS